MHIFKCCDAGGEQMILSLLKKPKSQRREKVKQKQNKTKQTHRRRSRFIISVKVTREDSGVFKSFIMTYSWQMCLQDVDVKVCMWASVCLPAWASMRVWAGACVCVSVCVRAECATGWPNDNNLSFPWPTCFAAESLPDFLMKLHSGGRLTQTSGFAPHELLRTTKTLKPPPVMLQFNQTTGWTFTGKTPPLLSGYT